MNWTGGNLNKFNRRKMTRYDLEKINIEKNIKKRQQQRQQSSCTKHKQDIKKRKFDSLINKQIICSKYFQEEFSKRNTPAITDNDNIDNNMIADNNENENDENNSTIQNQFNNENIVAEQLQVEIPFDEFAECYSENEINPNRDQIFFEPHNMDD